MGNGGEQLFSWLWKESLTVQIQHWLPMVQIPHGNLPLMMLQAKAGQIPNRYKRYQNQRKNALNFEICSDMHSTSHQGEPGTDSGVPIGGYVELEIKN